MTLVKIILVGVFVASLLGVAKQQQWFERAGIVSHCSVVAAPLGKRDGSQWWSCAKGSVTGYPSLERDSCESRGFVANHELWMCPTPLEQAPF